MQVKGKNGQSEVNVYPLTPVGTPQTPFGFPQRIAVPQPAAVPRPPAPKRPKGRWFVGLLLLGVCGFAVYTAWDSFFRYQAHGTVEGRAIQVPPPWDGVVRYLHVREGDRVHQGQLLVTVDNVELRQREVLLTNQLKVTQAELTAMAAKLRWQAAFETNRSQKAAAEYYQAWGALLQEQSLLQDLRTELGRAQRLAHAISDRERTQLEFRVKGQTEKIEQLKTGLAELKQRADQNASLLSKGGDLAAGLAEAGEDQLRPNTARIEAAQAELAEIQKRLEQAQVYAPANGVVLKTLRYAGEYCRADEPLLKLLEDGSLEVVLYMPQNASTLLTAGDEAEVIVEPHAQRVRCKVVRLGEQYIAPPPHIERQYWAKEKLLPIWLQPGGDSAATSLRPEAVVKLPYKMPAVGQGWVK
ncbi:MAG TPA: HlyD family efflux transporter periplasmic adaptor subunit [Fimbriiglobus sp.]|nr:HlyD family efflux transporter periplasmic adaptor subunit [Fimbriiglobus sp.]